MHWKKLNRFRGLNWHWKKTMDLVNLEYKTMEIVFFLHAIVKLMPFASCWMFTNSNIMTTSSWSCNVQYYGLVWKIGKKITRFCCKSHCLSYPYDCKCHTKSILLMSSLPRMVPYLIPVLQWEIQRYSLIYSIESPKIVSNLEIDNFFRWHNETRKKMRRNNLIKNGTNQNTNEWLNISGNVEL